MHPRAKITFYSVSQYYFSDNKFSSLSSVAVPCLKRNIIAIILVCFSICTLSARGYFNTAMFNENFYMHFTVPIHQQRVNSSCKNISCVVWHGISDCLVTFLLTSIFASFLRCFSQVCCCTENWCRLKLTMGWLFNKKRTVCSTTFGWSVEWEKWKIGRGMWAYSLKTAVLIHNFPLWNRIRFILANYVKIIILSLITE